MVTGSVVLAHQGGWDEALVLALPLLVFAILLAVANRRERRRRDQAGPPADSSDLVD